MMNTTSDTATTTTTSHHHDPPPPPDDDHQTITTTTTTTREVEYLDSFPVGYRFMPTDQELFHYLFLRYHKQTLPPNRFNEIILYDHHPSYLTSPGRFKNYENKEWYFFTPRDRRYPNGVRPRRSAGGGGDSKGYWKATGADRKINSKDSIVLGSKKTLVFYNGKAPEGIKTHWVMNEFMLDQTSIQKNSRPDMLLDDSVLCRIHIKEEKKSTTTRSGSRKRKRKTKSVSVAEEEDDDNNNHSQQQQEKDHLEEEANLSVRGETEAVVYNDTEDDHLISSDYDSIVDQYYPNTDHEHDHILMNDINSSCSTSIMGPVYSSSTTTSTTSTVVHGEYGAAVLQTSSHDPTSWVTAPILNEYSYMQDISGIAAALDMVSMSATHDTHNNISIGEQDDDGELINSLSSLFPDGYPPLPLNQQWMNSLSPMLVPDGHSPIPPNEQWMNSLSKFVPAGHPPLHKVLPVVPQGYSLPPPQMPPQMPPPQMQQQGYYHQYSSPSSSLWADSNNNIDGSSSGINKLHDECQMAMFLKGSKRPRFNKKYPESFDQTSFSRKTFNGSPSTDCGWSRR